MPGTADQPGRSLGPLGTITAGDIAGFHQAADPLGQPAPARRLWLPGTWRLGTGMRSARWRHAPGRLFAGLTVLPALLAMAWLLPGLPLLIAGRFTSLPVIAISAPLAVVLIATALRQLPSAWPNGIRGILAGPPDPGDAEAGQATGGEAGEPDPVAGPPPVTLSSTAVVPADTDAPPLDAPPLDASPPDAPPLDAPPPDTRPERALPPGAAPQAAPPQGGPFQGARIGPGPEGAALEDAGRESAGPESAGPEGAALAGRPARPATRPDVPWWALLATVAVAAGFTAWQFAMRSQQVIVLRDAGTYLQYAYWIAGHGSAHIPQSLRAFGGAHPGLMFGSTGFFQTGSSVVPQFMAGLPIILAAGVWGGGPLAAAAMAPVIGGCAVLAFGGLAARLGGARWAPAAALVLAISLPELYTSRTTFSEPLAQVMLFGGLCMLADSFVIGAGRRLRSSSWRDGLSPAATLALLGGLSLGLTVLIRIDGLSDLLPAIPFLGGLLAARKLAGIPFGAGLVIGCGYGAAGGYLLSRPYLDSLGSLLQPLAVAALVVLAATVIGMGIVSLRSGPRRLRAVFTARPFRWLPEAGAVAVICVLIGFAVRPYVQGAGGQTDPAAVSYVAGLQRLAGLPVNGHNQYYQDSLYWVIWYIGIPAVLLGAFGLALLVRRCLRALLTWRYDRAAQIWALPVMIICWVTVTVLWHPGILPDQPWASRRLVPVVLPGLILAAIWMSAWLRERGRKMGAGSLAASLVAACCVVALLVPPAVTTFGPGVERTAKGGHRPVAHGLAFKRTGAGEYRAVRGLCAQIGPGASVVILDPITADRFAQLIRGMCATPTARLDHPSAASVHAVEAGIRRAGRRPVLLAGHQSLLSPYGPAPQRILDLETRQDAHVLVQPPAGTWPVHFTVWMSRLGGLPGRPVASQDSEYSRRA